MWLEGVLLRRQIHGFVGTEDSWRSRIGPIWTFLVGLLSLVLSLWPSTFAKSAEVRCRCQHRLSPSLSSPTSINREFQVRQSTSLWYIFLIFCSKDHWHSPSLNKISVLIILVLTDLLLVKIDRYGLSSQIFSNRLSHSRISFNLFNYFCLGRSCMLSICNR